MVVRSPDLVNWEGPHGTLGNGSLFNPVLEHNDTSADRHIGDEAWNYKVKLQACVHTQLRPHFPFVASV